MTMFFTLAMAVAAASAAQAPAPAPADDHPVLELRQYKIVPGRREAMIALFEREFVESQEAVGARLVGQYRDLDDGNRFTWLRAFPNMAERARALNAFYFGPVWQAHRNEANPLLDDNDNVLLLRPAWTGGGFAGPGGTRPAPGAPAPAAGMVIATIYYLWKAPDEGFARFFHDRVAPRLAAAGLPLLGAYVPEAQPNNFPRLPVRQGEKLLVWFTRTADRAAFDRAMARLARSPGWRRDVAPGLADAQERPAQVLHLAPTPRSLLR
jgi:hypothetical protein